MLERKFVFKLSWITCLKHHFIDSGCTNGYNLIHGDVPGWGLQIKGRIKTNNKGCAKLCNEEKNCCSYEYSPTEKLCNLNKDCKPSAKVYKDYSFCVKGKLTRLGYFDVTDICR